MNKDIDNPPAFPMIGIESDQLQSGHIRSVYSYEQSKGMTLRDYFAGQVIQGFSLTNLTDTIWANNKAMVEEAYSVADEMLIERSKTAKQ